MVVPETVIAPDSRVENATAKKIEILLILIISFSRIRKMYAEKNSDGLDRIYER